MKAISSNWERYYILKENWKSLKMKLENTVNYKLKVELIEYMNVFRLQKYNRTKSSLQLSFLLFLKYSTLQFSIYCGLWLFSNLKPPNLSSVHPFAAKRRSDSPQPAQALLLLLTPHAEHFGLKLLPANSNGRHCLCHWCSLTL